MLYTFYKIEHTGDCKFVYVGSTLNFISRKCQHKHVCYNDNTKNHNLKVYQIIRENGGWDEWNMVPLEQCEFSTKLEARIREQHWINKYDKNLNSNGAIVDIEKKKKRTCYAKNKSYILKHRANNKDEYNDYMRNYMRNRNHNSWKYISKVFMRILL